MGAARGPSGVRGCTWLVLLAATTAAADDGTTIHAHLLREPPAEPLLHLDAAELDPTLATGGLSDRQASVIELGPHARAAAEGQWWLTGLGPSAFTDDLRIHGWRAAAELTYDLGPFSIGANVSMTHDGYASRRMVGLFAFRTFHLSRWMHAWIVFGVTLERLDIEGAPRREGVNFGFSLGTTFR